MPYITCQFKMLKIGKEGRLSENYGLYLLKQDPGFRYVSLLLISLNLLGIMLLGFKVYDNLWKFITF